MSLLLVPETGRIRLDGAFYNVVYISTANEDKVISTYEFRFFCINIMSGALTSDGTESRIIRGYS